MLNHLKGKKLYRSPKDALVFGIAAGLAQYLQVDVVFVRLIMIALAVFTSGWPMVLAYAVGVFLIPIDPSQDTVAPRQEPKDVTPPKRESEPVEKMDSDQNM
jgi:phage shock protein C